jgi:predicted RNase H-like HicB family nuclease
LSKQTTLTVNVSHDKQERVWYVLSSDIHGLHAEAETLDELVTVISDVAPDLIAANL